MEKRGQKYGDLFRFPESRTQKLRLIVTNVQRKSIFLVRCTKNVVARGLFVSVFLHTKMALECEKISVTNELRNGPSHLLKMGDIHLNPSVTMSNRSICFTRNATK